LVLAWIVAILSLPRCLDASRALLGTILGVNTS